MSHPIDEYVSALDQYRSKKREEAAETIAKALGGTTATEPIRSSLDKILKKDTLIHNAVLRTIVAEARKRDRNVGRK